MGWFEIFRDQCDNDRDTYLKTEGFGSCHEYALQKAEEAAKEPMEGGSHVRCGARCADGHKCKNPAGKCPHHGMKKPAKAAKAAPKKQKKK